MKRNLSVLMSAMLLVASLSACSSGSSSSAAPASSTAPASSAAPAASSVASSAAPAEPEVPTLPLAERLDLTGMIYIRDTDTIKVDENLWWVSKATEATNIAIDWAQTNASDWATQVNLMFASGDYPDIIYDADSTGIISSEIYGVDQGILRPIDDLLQYTPNYTEIYDQDTSGKLALTKSDGKVYAWGSYADYVYGCSNHFFINKIWRDNLGLENPKTAEELYSVMQAFRTQDPNKNGDPTDEIVYEGIFDELTTHFFFLFGIPEDSKHYSINDEGKVVFDPFLPGYREAITYMSNMYADGLMDPATITQDANSKISMYNQNNCGIVTAHRLRAMGWDPLMETMEFLMTPAAEGYSVKQNSSFGLPDERVFITSTNEHPIETALWINYQFDTQSVWETYYGPQGMIWDWVDGKCEIISGNDQGVMEYALGVNGAYYLPSFYYNTVFKQPDYRQERIDYTEQYLAAGFNEKYPTSYIKLGKQSVEQTTEIATLFANIETLYDQLVADMIMTGVDDAKWDNFITQMTAAGAERYCEIYQEILDTVELPA